MTSAEYIETRLDDQIKWYDRRATRSKAGFIWSQWIQIIAGALIPFLAAFGDQFLLRVVVATLGFVISVGTAVQRLMRFQEQWIHYRATAEAIKHEKYLFLGSGGGYAEAADPGALLIERVEALISQEHSLWLVQSRKPPGDERGESDGK